ncbi:Thiol peroxidase [Grimontia celer]|uniref:Thiol peroxidase n=1 Tax=Grimontia celer TaxID=1796497 RepID=A0A128F8G4_9GAMM|nr:thiol peroxidase [Grimontia celer]CZF83069.1 Thiol peroxidase [Grimontia celer]
MSVVTFLGSPVSIAGSLPTAGQIAPGFTLCTVDLSDITLADFKGKKVVLNIFPSIDTPVCATSVRTFNEVAASKENTVVLCISADLPFATKRFCSAENIHNVQTASLFRAPDFAENYGVAISDGPLAGLASRAVIVINEDGIVIHSELVNEITEEPSYETALSIL